MENWIMTADAARILGISTNGVRWLADNGKIKFALTPSGIRLFRECEVQALAQQRERKEEAA